MTHEVLLLIESGLAKLSLSLTLILGAIYYQFSIIFNKIMPIYKLVFYSLIAVSFSFLIHELTHWITGELLGYEMRMTLNTAYPINGAYTKPWHYTVTSALGPLMTLFQAIVFYLFIRRNRNKMLFPFLFTAFYLEILSGIMNYRNANDLGRIGRDIDIGIFTLPIIFVAIHYLLLYKTIKREKYDRKFILTTLVLILIFSSILILSRQKYNVVLI